MNHQQLIAKEGVGNAGRLLTIEQAAGRLGLSSATLRDWVWRRKLEYVRVGERAIRIRESTIREIIERGTVPARAAK